MATEASTVVTRWPRLKALKVRDIIDSLSICGCGTSTHWECILELLTEGEKHLADGPSESFYRDKWFEFGAKVLDAADLLEHGSAIGYAWLTEDGIVLLEFLREFGILDHDELTSAGHPAWASEFSWGAREDQRDAYGLWVSGVQASAGVRQ